MPNASWECMLDGDRNAFLKIYQENYAALFTYGFSLTCDKEITKDCIQDLFLELWKTKGTVKKEVENVRCYLFTWLRRKISRHIQSKKKLNSLAGVPVNFEKVESSYEELLIMFQSSEEKRNRINNAISKLTKKQIEVVRLKFFENLSYTQIAEKLSLTTRTIYNTIYEALHVLREDESLVAQ